MSPAKRVGKHFKRLGAVRVDLGNGRDMTLRGTHYRFPDGSTPHVPDNINDETARSMIEWADTRYGRVREDLDPTWEKVRGPKPVVDLARCRASRHAQERLAQMRSQGGLTYEEVLLALRAPTTVRWSERHKSWLWVGDRITVAASVDGTGFTTITTILWTDDGTWAQYPRPEKATAA